jgi:hypothetical protein
MEINIQNIEEQIFYDKKIRNILPDFKNLFDQWTISQTIPGMKFLALKSALELLNSLNENHIQILEEYFSDKILIDRLDHRTIANLSCTVDEINDLCKFSAFKEFCVYRNKDKVSLTFWR